MTINHIFLRLVEMKVTIVLVFFLLCGVSIATIYMTNPKSTLVVPVNASASATNIGYVPLNTLSLEVALRIDTLERAGDKERENEKVDEKILGINPEYYQIDNQSVFEEFVQVLRRKEVFKEHFADLFTGENEVVDFLREVSVRSPEESSFGRQQRTQWTVEVATSDPETALSAFFKAFDDASEIVRTDFEKRVRSLINVAKSSIQFQLADIETEIETEIERFDDSLIFEIAHLKEQAQIARALDIESNTLEAQQLGNSATLLVERNSSNPLFLRGYKALEREIELKSARSDKKNYIGKLIELNDRKRKLTNDKLIERLAVALEKSPLQQKDFSAAYYAESVAEIRSPTSKPVLYLVSAMASFVVALVAATLWILAGYALRSSKETTED